MFVRSYPVFTTPQHCAQTLLDFNGGASCVQVYVNQHDFFINRVRAEDNIDAKLFVFRYCSSCAYVYNVRRWDSLPDPDAPPPTSESGLQDLFQEIRTTVGQEAQIVQAVFPNPAYVMQVFLQRVFAQSVTLLDHRLLAASYANSPTRFNNT